MDASALTEEAFTALRELVDDYVTRTDAQRSLRTPGYGSINPVTWQIAGLREDLLQEVARTLVQLRFVVDPVTEQMAPSPVPGVMNLYYSIDATRPALFTADALYGDTVTIESIALRHEASVQSLWIHDIDQSLHGVVKRRLGDDTEIDA